jgi:hypothetical protein
MDGERGARRGLGCVLQSPGDRCLRDPRQGRLIRAGARHRLPARDLRGVLPRIALVIVWITTNLVDRAFSTWVIPLLGLFLLPFTTLVFVLVWTPGLHLGNGRWTWVALAFVVELAGYGGTARSGRR